MKNRKIKALLRCYLEPEIDNFLGRVEKSRVLRDQEKSWLLKPNHFQIILRLLTESDFYWSAMAIEKPWVERLIHSILHVRYHRQLRKSYRQQMRAARRITARTLRGVKANINDRRANLITLADYQKAKKSKVKKPRVKKFEGKSVSTNYVFTSGNYSGLHHRIIEPLSVGAEPFPRAVPENKTIDRYSTEFSMFMFRYKDGGLSEERFVGGIYESGIMITVRARWKRRRRNPISWKIISMSRLRGDCCATWARGMVWQTKKLPVTLQQKLRENLPVGSHLVEYDHPQAVEA